MSDDYQIEIPPSFIAVFSDARQRLRIPLAELRQRYESCEDLAQQLTGHAQTLYHTAAPSEENILRTLHAGLAQPDAGIQPEEATWVVRRLAELLEWRCPELAETAAPPPA